MRHLLRPFCLLVASACVLIASGCARDPREVTMPAENTATLAPAQAEVPVRVDEAAQDAVGGINGVSDAEESAVDALSQ